MGRRKRWHELTRRQRREVRGYLRLALRRWLTSWTPDEESLRAALRELREPKR